MCDSKEKRWYFDIYQQWTEIFSSECNWKNFNFIIMTIEYYDKLKPIGYGEFHIGFLGFGMLVTYIPPGITADMQNLLDTISTLEDE